CKLVASKLFHSPRKGLTALGGAGSAVLLLMIPGTVNFRAAVLGRPVPRDIGLLRGLEIRESHEADEDSQKRAGGDQKPERVRNPVGILPGHQTLRAVRPTHACLGCRWGGVCENVGGRRPYPIAG